MACTKETVKPSGLNIWSSEAADGPAPAVDIIAVQGLGADPFYTWVKKVSSTDVDKPKRLRDKVQFWKGKKPQDIDRNDDPTEVMWIRDLLVPMFKDARIATYSYKSDWTDRAVKTNLRECANFFLNALLHYRQQESERQRPIVLIGHSLGCVVIQQALVSAASSRHFHDLGLSVAGIIFLGAPLQGSDAARWGTWLAQALQYDSTMLRLLQKNSRPLFDVAKDFSDCRNEWDLVCFYETRDAKYGPLKVQSVSQQSATYLGKRMMPLNTNHSGLNKFSRVDDENFVLVLPEIRRMVEKGRSIIAELGMSREGGLLEQADSWIRDKHYTEDMLKIDRLSGEQLSMDQCYINLAIVENLGRDIAYSEGSKIDPFSLLARLKIETPDKDNQVELKTLFNPRKGPDGRIIQPRRIFIRGRAGVGKTTLCKRIVHDFKNYKNRKDRKDPIWNDLFDRVLWVPLRNLKRKPDKGYNLEGLFLRDFFLKTPTREHLAKELERELDVTKFSRTLFVLDGLDEVSEGLDKDNEMYQFLKFLLEQPNVIIMSRPFARFSYNLHPDLELETIGFYPDQINTYVDKAFTDLATAKIDPKAGEIQTFLQDHWLIQGLVRIPIQLDALCYTWNKSSLSEAALETMTAMYQAIEHRLWKKDILRLEKTHNGKLVTENFIQEASRAKIEDFVMDEISFLECLAFAGLHNNIIDFETEHRNAIADRFVPKLLLDQTLPCLSFLRRSNPSAEDYHFLHLTYQEYFAARYFIRQWIFKQDLKWPELKTQETRRGRPVYSQDNTVSYLREHKYNARYNVFWRFVAGLLDTEGGNETLRFFQTIEDEPRDLLGPVHQRLVMHCLSEVALSQLSWQFSELREYLEGQLKQWLLFECNFTFNNTRFSQLVAEIEFPERVLKDILQKESDNIKEKILNSLTARPRLSPAIIELVSSYLGNDISISLKTAALSIFQRHYKALTDEIVQVIAALLKDPDVHVRRAATEALGSQSALADKIVQAVAALLKDPDRTVRRVAAKALYSQSALADEIVQAVVALLKDPDCEVRRVAAKALRSQSALADEMVQAIATSLEDSDWAVRKTVTRILGNQSALADEIIQAIVTSLKDPDWEVRRAAIKALYNQSLLTDKIIQAMIALLKDPDRENRRAAAEALGSQSALADKIVQAIAALLKDPDREVRRAAARTLGSQSALADKIMQAIAALLKDPDGTVRRAAVKALGNQSVLIDEIIQAMTALPKDPDREVREAAVRALSNQSVLTDKIIQAMTALLKDPDMYVRKAAAEALGSQSALADTTVQAIAALLKDPNGTVRRAAAETLGSQSALADEMVQAVAALLKDPEWYVRKAAAEALGSQSALADEMVQAVAALLKDPDWVIRWAATRALGSQSALADEMVQAVAALLKDPDREVRRVASQVLGQQAALSDKSDWLERSFSDHLTWYIKGNNYSINLPEGSRDIPFDQLQNAVQEAQRSVRMGDSEDGF